MVNKLQGFPNPESIHPVVFEASNSSIFQGQVFFLAVSIKLRIMPLAVAPLKL